MFLCSQIISSLQAWPYRTEASGLGSPKKRAHIFLTKDTLETRSERVLLSHAAHRAEFVQELKAVMTICHRAGCKYDRCGKDKENDIPLLASRLSSSSNELGSYIWKMSAIMQESVLNKISTHYKKYLCSHRQSYKAIPITVVPDHRSVRKSLFFYGRLPNWVRLCRRAKSYGPMT